MNKLIDYHGIDFLVDFTETDEDFMKVFYILNENKNHLNCYINKMMPKFSSLIKTSTDDIIEDTLRMLEDKYFLKKYNENLKNNVSNHFQSYELNRFSDHSNNDGMRKVNNDSRVVGNKIYPRKDNCCNGGTCVLI